MLFSDTPKRFDRKMPTWDSVVQSLPRQDARKAQENRARLSGVAELLTEEAKRSDRFPDEGEVALAVADRYEDPVVKASVLAFLLLDAHLTLFKQPSQA
jgi:hypothetical protein